MHRGGLDPARASTGRLFTKRTAEDWLRERLDEVRRGTLPGMVRTGAPFAEAAAEWLRYIERDRGRTPSTVVGYRAILRSQLPPAFGEYRLEDITTPMVEAWVTGLDPAPRSMG